MTEQQAAVVIRRWKRLGKVQVIPPYVIMVKGNTAKKQLEFEATVKALGARAVAINTKDEAPRWIASAYVPKLEPGQYWHRSI